MAEVTLLYFAWVRERIGKADERLILPPEVMTFADLAALLANRGGGYAEAFADVTKLRVAADQTMTPLDAPLAGAREIAFFPPVTGG